ncbi:unnamed protein product [Macrosiphum euphorbiae]|uniref:Uncharacterized protein n=1 Tax=Macrosiphum euphorbiae TaxID=13131 RepID=A0AAV0W6K9_9HEMI|nr:unnamed protein product [Macrosiphum euphorbiae]
MVTIAITMYNYYSREFSPRESRGHWCGGKTAEKKNRDSSATSFSVAVNKWRADGRAGDGGDGDDDGGGDGATTWFGHRGRPAAVTRCRMVPRPGRRTGSNARTVRRRLATGAVCVRAAKRPPAVCGHGAPVCVLLLLFS